METFTVLKKLANNPEYTTQKEKALQQLDYSLIDSPVIPLIKKMNVNPFCFTLQCCYGHFLYNGQSDLENIEPIPQTQTIDQIDYRIAYIAFCVENNRSGQQFLKFMKDITTVDPKYVQFGCADWFWKNQVNSYAVQVEPGRYKTKDRVLLNYFEALHVEKIRNRLFSELNSTIKKY